VQLALQATKWIPLFVVSAMPVTQALSADFFSRQRLCSTAFVIPFCARNFGSLVFVDPEPPFLSKETFRETAS
jgi:hypothetical protein